MKFISGLLLMLLGIVWGAKEITEGMSNGAWWNVVPLAGLCTAAIIVAIALRSAITRRAKLNTLLNVVQNFIYLAQVAPERPDAERFVNGLRLFTLPPEAFKRLL